MLQAGIKGRQTCCVAEANTARAVGSGVLDVFATPSMIALMEQTAWKSVAEKLEDGETTVGTGINVSHQAPTPVGMEVVCESELVEVDGRRLTFRVTARDEKGVIGEGEHERFIVRQESFQRKADQKKAD